jgi:ADP-ribosylglycohydrolase
MPVLTLTVESYRDKVMGGWLGKSVGVTLGTSMRGQLVPGRFNYYSPVPGQPAASAAIDFPVVWLAALEQAGPELLPEDLAAAWLEHLDYNQDEFGYAALNLRRGLPPPSSGAHSNWFKTSMGGVMRADFWAMVAPGNPQAAAAYAYHDSKLDHSEDGIWAAMFLAALGSAAFFLNDPLTLLTIGLAMIPRTSRTARGIKAALAAVQRGAGWLEARESVQHEVGHKNWSDVAQNMGFFTIGLFYGNRDFGSSMCAATNCGYDAELTGGALGAVLGIQRGKSGLPENWTRPIGDLVIPGVGVRSIAAPQTITELGERTALIGKRIAEVRCPEIGIVDQLVEPILPDISLPPMADAAIEPTDATVASDSETSHLEADATAPIANPAPLVPEPSDANEPTIRPLIPEFSEPPAPAPPIEFDPVPSQAATDDSGEPAPILAQEAAPQGGAINPADTNGSSQMSSLTPQAVDRDAPQLLSPEPQLVGSATATGVPLTPDPVSAIAWADSTMVKPLLVTPPNAFFARAGDIDVVMNAGESPTIAYNSVRTLTFTLFNRGSEPFSGRISLLAPLGWQVAGPPALGQRQYLAAGTGSLRIDFNLRVNEGQGRVDIANALTIRLAPDTGGAVMEAEFMLLGASCWWTVGPFANFDGEGFDRSFTPEDRPGLHESYVTRTSNAARWERGAFAESCMELESIFKSSSGVCYGQTNLRCSSTRDARIVANTNSGVKIWMNGVMIMRRMHRETFRPVLGAGQWSTDVTLRAGDNPIMVKWVRGSEPYEFSLTVSDRFGRGLPDVGNTSW